LQGRHDRAVCCRAGSKEDTRGARNERHSDQQEQSVLLVLAGQGFGNRPTR
jgi:hypothetical protein